MTKTKLPVNHCQLPFLVVLFMLLPCRTALCWDFVITHSLVAPSTTEGSGTQNNPYVICSGVPQLTITYTATAGNLSQPGECAVGSVSYAWGPPSGQSGTSTTTDIWNIPAGSDGPQTLTQAVTSTPRNVTPANGVTDCSSTSQPRQHSHPVYVSVVSTASGTWSLVRNANINNTGATPQQYTYTGYEADMTGMTPGWDVNYQGRLLGNATADILDPWRESDTCGSQLVMNQSISWGVTGIVGLNGQLGWGEFSVVLSGTKAGSKTLTDTFGSTANRRYKVRYHQPAWNLVDFRTLWLRKPHETGSTWETLNSMQSVNGPQGVAVAGGDYEVWEGCCVSE